MAEHRFTETTSKGPPFDENVEDASNTVELVVDDCNSDVFVAVSHEGLEYEACLEVVLSPKQAREVAKALEEHAEIAERRKSDSE